MSVMQWGLLWFDSDGTLEDRIRRASLRYWNKFGEYPNTCIVPAGTIEKDDVVINGCTIISHHTVLEDHLWIGVR